MEKLERILVEHKIRVTSIRLMVLKHIMAQNRAFTLADMEASLETVERSTLFRTLTLFLLRRILHEVDNGCGSKLYCLCAGNEQGVFLNHVHFTCYRCGRTYCIKDIDAMPALTPKGFAVEEVSCVMKGICPDCQ